MAKIRVLFVCTSNTARSQMAEALLRNSAGDRYDVYSAGLEPGVMSPLMTAVMKERGISMKDHYSKAIDGFLGYDFDFVIVVCSKAELVCPSFPAPCVRLYWPFDDPEHAKGTEEEKLVQFRTVRDQIDAKIREWLQEHSA
jgi:arsenate reductase (thioredoxin)